MGIARYPSLKLTAKNPLKVWWLVEMIHVLFGAFIRPICRGRTVSSTIQITASAWEPPRRFAGIWFDDSIRPGIGRHADRCTDCCNGFLDVFFLCVCVWKNHQEHVPTSQRWVYSIHASFSLAIHEETVRDVFVSSLVNVSYCSFWSRIWMPKSWEVTSPGFLQIWQNA